MNAFYTEIDGVMQPPEVTKVVLYLNDEIEKRDLEIVALKEASDFDHQEYKRLHKETMYEAMRQHCSLMKGVL